MNNKFLLSELNSTIADLTFIVGRTKNPVYRNTLNKNLLKLAMLVAQLECEEEETANKPLYFEF